MNLRDKKILITGGSGFIGLHLIERLIAEKAKVENFDLSQGLDVTDKDQVTRVIKKQFDVIYHLAGFSGSTRSNKDIRKSFEVNSLPAIYLCEAIVRYSPSTKLIMSSSRLEYGVPKYLPVDENHPTQPNSVYGLSKLAATQIALIFNKSNNLDVTVFRTSNVYGPHTSKKFTSYNVINHFIDLATRGRTLKIFGDGNQQRDYLYVDDLIDAFLLASNKKSSGQVYNLGFGQGIKFKDMVSLIIKKLGKGNIKFVKWPNEFEDVETGNYITDISKIKNNLGFMPRIGFEEGISRIINNK